MSTIDIEHVTLEKYETYQEMSAAVDGEKIWFRFPLFLDLKPCAELFMAPAMMESMIQGRPVRIKGEIAISRRLARNWQEIQSVFKSWNPDFLVSPLEAEQQRNTKRSDNVITCFSGGVDSCYTYARHREDVTHLLLVQCFEDWTDPEAWRDCVAQRQAFADAQGVKLITVETNARHYYEKRKISHKLIHGSILATIGLTLNPKQMFIPSSDDYYTGLIPWGSHPLLDHLWSTETTEIIHHGCGATRCEKTAYIAGFQNILDQIQVCWNSSTTNCGHCSKCVRTAVAFNIYDKTSAALPDITDNAQLRAITVENESDLIIINELIELCKAKGHGEILACLNRQVRGYKKKAFLSYAVKKLIGRVGRNFYRRYIRKSINLSRATLTPTRHN